MDTLSSLAAWLKQETSVRRPRLDPAGVVKRTASVLILLLPGPEGPEVLFEVRSKRLDWQPGDICFPGGRREKTDRNFAAAAIRETSEELGIHYEDIRLCGTLDFFAAHNGFMVYPFVGIWQPGGRGCNPLRTSPVVKKPQKREHTESSFILPTPAVTASRGNRRESLTHMDTIASRKNRQELQPAVDSSLSPTGTYPDYKNWRFNKAEVEELFTVPLRELLQIKPRVGTNKVLLTRGEDFPFALVPHLDPTEAFHKDYAVYFYVYKERVIWGMTAAILHSFLERFGKGLSDFA